jgi:hypothetical protein
MREYNGGPPYPDGTWLGCTYGIAAGTSTINASASLWKGPVYPVGALLHRVEHQHS